MKLHRLQKRGRQQMYMLIKTSIVWILCMYLLRVSAAYITVLFSFPLSTRHITHVLLYQTLLVSLIKTCYITVTVATPLNPSLHPLGLGSC